jgi:hypothetical protein
MIFTSFLQYEKVHMSLNDHLVAMSETQPWTSFALLELNFQFLELNFQFLEDNFKMSEPCGNVKTISTMHVSRKFGRVSRMQIHNALQFN